VQNRLFPGNCRITTLFLGMYISYKRKPVEFGRLRSTDKLFNRESTSRSVENLTEIYKRKCCRVTNGGFVGLFHSVTCNSKITMMDVHHACRSNSSRLSVTYSLGIFCIDSMPKVIPEIAPFAPPFLLILLFLWSKKLMERKLSCIHYPFLESERGFGAI
jgi:hypothetical protein